MNIYMYMYTCTYCTVSDNVYTVLHVWWQVFEVHYFYVFVDCLDP